MGTGQLAPFSCRSGFLCSLSCSLSRAKLSEMHGVSFRRVVHPGVDAGDWPTSCHSYSAAAFMPRMSYGASGPSITLYGWGEITVLRADEA